MVFSWYQCRRGEGRAFASRSLYSWDLGLGEMVVEGGRFKHRMLAVLPPSPCWAWSVGMTSLGRNCNSCYPASALCLWQAGRSTARDPGTHSNRLSSALARTARLTPVTVWSQWHWLQEVSAVGWDWLGFIPSRSLQSLTEDKAVILAAHMLIAKNLLLLACSKTF